MSNPRYAIALGLIAVALSMGASASVLGMLLGWAALSFGWVASAYASDTPGMFGKQPDGTRSLPFALITGPYRLYCQLVLAVLERVDPREPWHWLSDDVVLGRRSLGTGLPSELQGVIDLTSELDEATVVLDAYVWVNVPLLDAGAASPRVLDRCVEALAGLPKPALIHCAQGSGRTSMVAAAWLLSQGLAETVDDAVEGVAAARPGARPNAAQMEALRVWFGGQR